MPLKRDNWTNDEVIAMIEGFKMNIPEGKQPKQWVETHNQALDMAAIQFGDFKKDPENFFDAMAYNTEDKMVYVISEPMPQTEEEYQAYVKKQEEKNNGK